MEEQIESINFEENNDILISLLTEMKIKTHMENKDKLITMTLMQLQEFCIKLLKLEGSVK